MRKISIIAAFLLSIMLFSCRQIENEYENIPKATEAETTASISEETTESSTTELKEELPCFIGFYDDLENNGNYTRLTEWTETWISGKDIAVFDVIPSNAPSLSGSSYRKLWVAEAEKLSEDQLVKPGFLIEYTLKDGTSKSLEINSYKDAEALTKEGMIEVYLYDDIHQEEGAWYYHLTEDTTNSDTVISSIKLTAGKDIEKVVSIRLTAYTEGSTSAVIDIKNGIS